MSVAATCLLVLDLDLNKDPSRAALVNFHLHVRSPEKTKRKGAVIELCNQRPLLVNAIGSFVMPVRHDSTLAPILLMLLDIRRGGKVGVQCAGA